MWSLSITFIKISFQIKCNIFPYLKLYFRWKCKIFSQLNYYCLIIMTFAMSDMNGNGTKVIIEDDVSVFMFPFSDKIIFTQYVNCKITDFSPRYFSVFIFYLCFFARKKVMRTVRVWHWKKLKNRKRKRKNYNKKRFEFEYEVL